MAKAAPKKTVKDLNKDFELLQEKFEHLKIDQEEKIKIIKSDNEERIKHLQEKIVALEHLTGLDYVKDKERKYSINCKECSFSFEEKSDLKKHILALHPKQYSCKLCAEVFETSVALELHIKVHNSEKEFKCDICDKEFHMKWRLGKHMKLHESTNFKYCHFFSNRKFCNFEELGCMFRHEHAPLCKRGKFCHAKMCQFQHEETEEPSKQTNENQSIIETDEEINFPCNNCNFISKTEAYLQIHQVAKHQAKKTTRDKNVISDENCDDAIETDDDECEDDDGPMECNHCGLNGVKPVYVTDDFDDLLRHIWNDHKENSAWGPSR